jgi:hypothetical protein
MPNLFSIDLKIQNTNAETVNVQLELTDPLNVRPVQQINFGTLAANTTQTYTVDGLPEENNFQGVVKFFGIDSQLLDSLPITIGNFQTKVPITNLVLNYVDDDEFSFGALGTNETQTLQAQLFFVDANVGYPLNNPNYLYEYTLEPLTGLTGDQTKLVKDSVNPLKYNITDIPGAFIILAPFNNTGIIDQRGVQVQMTKPSTSSQFTGSFRVRFEMKIKASALNPLGGSTTYVSSYKVPVTVSLNTAITIGVG